MTVLLVGEPLSSRISKTKPGFPRSENYAENFTMATKVEFIFWTSNYVVLAK